MLVNSGLVLDMQLIFLPCWVILVFMLDQVYILLVFMDHIATKVFVSSRLLYLFQGLYVANLRGVFRDNL